ncbi:uncharacterized protein PHACADRAFT_88712 [Phanerochaete carnosa HHB-10118-sp]|uniref:Zinc finger Mcm10/DnaG-type domain-containing protein n=1 Tax=Phanerochaete carnosa (strain HHB-10118-sp) TaxID=650164 RepID=K5WG80_PHACS|nr:uncharacterized protein PHACADRAFT_88712 [Phanerochaete carnosa HHB-10118-sp]EKM58109.1 hypothetical protein PHACADRAFT_88712 [Phanerochaete carnosa HHB-10118-sp]
MDSSSSRKQDETRRQAEIRRQIAALQAQLKDASDEEGAGIMPPSTPRKRKQSQQNLLASATPSPSIYLEKRKAEDHRGKAIVTFPKNIDGPSSRAQQSRPSLSFKTNPAYTARPPPASSLTPASSSVLSKLAGFASASTKQEAKAIAARSSGFAEKPPTRDEVDEETGARDENLTIVEDLTIGPYEHRPPFDDPHFMKLEPSSGIRLSSRTLPHDEFQDYLRGRYYLSPSKLYSVIRLLPNKQGYDVPVEGDWVTIAVVAERGPMKYSKASVGIGKEDLAEHPNGEDDLGSLALGAPPKPARPQWGKGKAKEEPSKPSGKKYMNLKLVDFGCRTKSSATAGKSIIRGDALLSLLLFESDRVEEVTQEDGKKEKVYRGGSRGAFERLSKLKEGTIVALLNPKILKPFQRSGDAPHPTDNILALTPESLQSILVLGHSQDLGMCHVVKRDGKACGSWCDKRISDVCDYHVQHAVQAKRAGRAEFTTGTSGMSAFAKKKPAYDPSRQWGLKPDPDASTGGATYVVSGHIVSDRRESGLFVNETIGREAQAKAARKVSAKDADEALKKLLKQDKEGTRAVKAAREFGKKLVEKEVLGDSGKGKEEAKDVAKTRRRDENDNDDSEDEKDKKSVKNAYSATLVRSLGFDPTAKDGRRVADSEVQRKVWTFLHLMYMPH